jgi:hypothetical protein
METFAGLRRSARMPWGCIFFGEASSSGVLDPLIERYYETAEA